MNDGPAVAVIIVNWNGKADTLACLASLSLAELAGGPFRIVVVDNGSSDGSVAAIRAAHPTVQLIEAGRNLGFTGGNNLGVGRALADGAEAVFLLNNDTTVEPDAISNLRAAAAANPRAGLLTPVIHYFDHPNDAWFAGARMDLPNGIAVHDNSSPPRRDELPRKVPWASGCAMFIRAEVWRKIRGFDDRFFLNWEDVDLSLRVVREGWDILLVPSAQIYHKVGRSFATAAGTGTYYYVRNQLLIAKLHAPRPWIAIVNVVAAHLRRGLRGVLRREDRSLESIRIIAGAMADFARNRFGRRMSSVA